MRVTLITLSIALLVGIARPASAVTRDEIARLAGSGVSDEVILTLLDRDKTIFALTPDDIVALKQQGVSDAVVTAMLRSGREEGEAALAQQSAQAAAERLETAWLAPNVVVIGHGPDRPNSGHYDRGYGDAWYGFGYVSSYPHAPRYPYPAVRAPLCVAQIKAGPTNPGLAYVTGCPLQVPPGRSKLAR
jgi:hypothetical protein